LRISTFYSKHFLHMKALMNDRNIPIVYQDMLVTDALYVGYFCLLSSVLRRHRRERERERERARARERERERGGGERERERESNLQSQTYPVDVVQCVGFPK